MDIVLTAAQATKRHNYTQMMISGVIRELQGFLSSCPHYRESDSFHALKSVHVLNKKTNSQHSQFWLFTF